MAIKFAGVEVINLPKPLVLAGNASSELISQETGADGETHYRFRKELISVGRYEKEEDGIEFEITPPVLDHWKTQIDKFQEVGERIPLVEDHDDVNAEKSRGQVVGAEVADGSLYGIVDVIGEEGKRIALNNDVSINSPASYTDGKGNTYQRPIDHVALTPKPVIPGLKGWEGIAASRVARKEKKVDWTELAKALGITETLTDENAMSLVLSHLKAEREAFHAKIKELESGGDSGKRVRLSRSKPEGDEGKTEEPEVDATILELAAENRTIKLSQLVEAGAIDANTQKELTALYVGDDNGELALTLSKGGDDKFNKLIPILLKNKPVSLGEQSGQQTIIQLGKDVMDGGQNPLLRDAAQRAEEARQAG